MAAEAIIGALRVILGADTGQLEEGTRRAAKQLNMFDKAVKDATGGLLSYRGLISTIASGAFVAFLKSSAKAGEEIEKNSKRLGISAEAYQELAYAAEITGVSQEALTSALGKLQRGLGDTDEGAKKTQTALAQLGLSVEQVRALKPEEQYTLIADRLSRVSDVARQTAIGSDLMGKSFGEVRAVMTLSSAELQKFADEARRLGFIMSDETVAKLGKADDEFDKLGAALRVAGRIIAAEFLPWIEMARKIVTSPEFQQGVKDFKANLEALFKVMKDNAPVLTATSGALIGMRFGALLGPVGKATGAIIGFGAGAISAMTDLQKVEIELRNARLTMALFEDQVKRLERAMEIEPTMWRKEKLTEVSHALDEQKKTVENLEAQYQSLSGSAERTQLTLNKPPPPDALFSPEFLKKIEDSIAQLNFKAALARGEFDMWPEGFMEAAVSLGLFKLNADGTTEAVAGLEEQITRASIAQQKFNEATKQNQGLNKLITDAKNVGKNIDDFVVSSLNKMGDAFTDVITGAKDAATAWKDFAKAVVEMLVRMLVQMLIVLPIATALKAVLGIPVGFVLPFAGGGSFVAGAGRGGIGHAAAGASFTVPGGSMGVDTTFVPMALAPGERVDITPAEQVMSGNRYLELPSINPRDFFTGETVRELVFAIDQWMRDGGTGVRFVKQ